MVYSIFMKNITKYFGFVAVGLEWVTLLILVLTKTPDLNEPFSQYGLGSTRLLFGTTLTLVAILIFFFMRHLDAYWKHSSFFGLVAGLLLAFTGWVPYQPHVSAFVFDAHNICVLLGLILYLVPVFFITYNKSHQKMARVSKYIFWLLTACAATSVVLRTAGGNVIYIQLISIIIFQTWIIITSVLLLEHHKEITAGHTGKL